MPKNMAEELSTNCDLRRAATRLASSANRDRIISRAAARAATGPLDTPDRSPSPDTQMTSGVPVDNPSPLLGSACFHVQQRTRRHPRDCLLQMSRQHVLRMRDIRSRPPQGHIFGERFGGRADSTWIGPDNVSHPGSTQFRSGDKLIQITWGGCGSVTGLRNL